MKDLVEVVGLAPLLRKAGIPLSGISDFEAAYSALAATNRLSKIKARVEQKLLNYFDAIELPRQATMYDKLILSLRRKDMIASFNWDPLLAHALRRNRHLRELPEIVFLHGNVAVGICHTHDTYGFYGAKCGVCDREYEQSRLLYPVLNKRYRDNPFISDQWTKLEAKLREAFIVTIIGYAAPVSDKAARELMHLAWNTNGTRTLADVEIVNRDPRRTVMKRWADFITGDHFHVTRRVSSTLSFRFPRRSCEALAGAVLQNDPWRENPMPRFRRLQNLQSWCGELIAEERNYYEHGEGLKRW